VWIFHKIMKLFLMDLTRLPEFVPAMYIVYIPNIHIVLQDCISAYFVATYREGLMWRVTHVE